MDLHRGTPEAINEAMCASVDLCVEGISRDYGLSASRLFRFSQREIDYFNQYSIDCSLRQNYANPMLLLRFFLGVASHLPSEEALNILEQIDLNSFSKKFWLLEHLSDPATPLYPLRQLSDYIEKFVRHLEQNYEAIVNTGVSKESFKPSSWIDWYLSPAICIVTANSQGQECPSGNDLLPNEMQKIVKYRSKLLQVQGEVLKACKTAIRSGNYQALWKSLLITLTSTYTAEEIKLQISNDIESTKGLKAGLSEYKSSRGLPDYNGGIYNLIALAGHIEEELRVGIYGKIAQEVFPIIRDQPLMAAYLRAIGRSQQGLLDKVLDNFWALDQEADDFWQEFESRVSDTLENEFNIELRFAVSVKSKDKTRVEAVISPLIKFLAGFLKETGELVPVNTAIEEVLTKTRGSRSGNIFQKIGEYWVIVFEGKAIIIEDREGVDYVAYLIYNQGRDFEFYDLVNAVEGHMPSYYYSVDNCQPIAEGLSHCGSSYLKERLRGRTREEYKREIKELTEELEGAERLNDTGRASDIRQKIEWLKSELIADYSRRTDKGDPINKYNKTVCARVRRVKEAITKAHPSLGKHLAAVKVGFISSYKPPKYTPWET